MNPKWKLGVLFLTFIMSYWGRLFRHDLKILSFSSLSVCCFALFRSEVYFLTPPTVIIAPLLE
jgi:hypothetical protein